MINLGGQNEPPHKKQRTSDTTEPMVSNTPPQSQTLSMVKKKSKVSSRNFTSIFL
jgi:hypothetical protein